MKSSASTKRAGEGGWISWLRRFFQGSPARPANTQAHASATPRAAAPGPPPTAAALEASSAHCPELASYAQALGLTLIAPSPLTEAQQVEAEQLTAAIVAADASDEAVPSGLPTAALRTLNLVAKPDLELSDLASAVQQDPALTAAVLRVANSAAVSGAAGPIRTVREAITRLGVSESARVAGVVAAQTLFSPQSKRALALFGLRLCELHVAAATIAGSAAQLSMERRVGRMDLTYLGGMLHEVGKTLALSTLAHMIQSGHAPQDIQPAVLEAVLDRVHVSLGGRAHRSWELPAYLIALCETQYAPTIPHDSEHTEQHLVRVVSGLHQLRARPLPRERLLCSASPTACRRWRSRPPRHAHWIPGCALAHSRYVRSSAERHAARAVLWCAAVASWISCCPASKCSCSTVRPQAPRPRTVICWSSAGDSAARAACSRP